MALDMSSGFDLGSAFAKILIDESGVDSGISSVKEKFQSLSQSLISTGASLTAIGLPFLGVAAAAVKSYTESQNSLAQLDAVLRSTSGAAGVTRDQAIELSKAFEQETKFSDEAVLGAENIILTFTNIGKNVFPLATQTALDMSQALGQDLKSSSIQISKALQDPIKGITALTRVGVNFTQAQKDMIKTMVEAGKTEDAQRVILNELQKEFGGSAVAAGETFSGQLVILQNKFDDLLETIGEKLIPMLDTFIGYISGLIDWFQNLDPSIQNIIIGIGAFMASLALLGPVIAAIGVGIGAIGTLLGALFSPIGLVIAAIVGLYLAFQSNFLGIHDFLVPIFQKIGDFFAHFSDNVKLYGSLAVLYFAYYMQGIGEAIQKVIDAILDFIKNNQTLVEGIVVLGGILLLAAGLSAVFTGAMAALGAVVAIGSTLLTGIGGLIALLTGPVGLVALLVALVAAAALGYPGGLPALLKDAANSFTLLVASIDIKLNQWLQDLTKDFTDLYNRILPVINLWQSLSGLNSTSVLNGIVNTIAPPPPDPVSAAYWATHTSGSVGATSGVQPIPPVGGGSAAAPSGSVGVGAQGMNFHENSIVINANTKAGGQAAAAGFMDELQARYYGRGNG